MSTRAASDAPVVVYARGVAGGLIAGMPLLYTMEVWWLGETARPGHVLAMLAFAALPVGLLVLTAGFRREERPTLGDVVGDTFTAMALGVTTCAVVLVALDQMELGTSPVAAIEQVVVQAAPFALGVAVATQVFRRDDDEAGDEDGRGSPDGSPGWATVRDLAATATGALFFGLAIAPTEEIPMIASGLRPTDAAGLVLVSLVATYLIVFIADFADVEGRRSQRGALQHPLSETVAAYVVTLVVALCMLWAFDNLAGGPLAVLVQTVVLGFPAGIGGATGRLLA